MPAETAPRAEGPPPAGRRRRAAVPGRGVGLRGRRRFAWYAAEWAARIERGLVRITTVTRLEVGYSARSGPDLRAGLQQPPLVAMPVEYQHSTYVGGLLGPMLVTAADLGLLFMPATLVALSKVEDRDAGLASSLVNTGQQVGGAIGLAVLGTVAWTVVADTARSSAAAARTAAVAAAKAGHPVHVNAAPRRPRSTITRWRSDSPVGSRYRPRSCCSH